MRSRDVPFLKESTVTNPAAKSEAAKAADARAEAAEKAKAAEDAKAAKTDADKVGDAKTDADKADEKRAAAAKRRAGMGLAPAGQSGDPEVQKLLADRQAHVSNAGLEPDPAAEAVRKDSLAAIDEIDDRLAELGFTAV